MLTGLLVLADSRLPAGGHAHSGGVEPAMASGLVGGLDSLRTYLLARLRSTGLVSAAFTAATTHAVRSRPPEAQSDRTAVQSRAPAPRLHRTDGAARSPGSPPQSDRADGAAVKLQASALQFHRVLAELDGELDARTPSAAQRRTSRQQGRALHRAALRAWPSPCWEPAARKHHPIVLGTAAALAGGDPHEAARVAAYLAVSGPAGAAVRLGSYDPIAVNALLAGLAPDIDAIAEEAAGHATDAPSDLPAATAPRLDLLAESHAQKEMTLFAS